MRSVGRRASQVGNFFIRNLALPIGIAGFAAGKAAGQFETSLSKISGITNTTTRDTQRLAQAMLGLSSRVITKGPNDLADAAFELQSVGFKTNQTIAALGPIAKAAAVGLGSVRIVADATASALDAYGIAGQQAGRLTLTANQAVAVLIGTINAGKLPPEELAAAIGRVIPLANAMGISFDQVGASIAAMTRQGLNANLSVTGLRALLSQIARAQPTTEKAFASIGTSAGAVQHALRDPNIGLLPTLLALREEFNKLGDKPPKFNKDLLKDAANGNGAALAKIRADIGTTNKALTQAFPNTRALVSFLILTGPRRNQNATIFAQLKNDVEHSQDVIKRAYEAKLKTPIGQLQLALGQLREKATETGDSFIKVGSDLVHFGVGIIGAVQGVNKFFAGLGPLKHVVRDSLAGLILFGPVVALFGRLTQALSFGVFAWGRWQTAATRAAFAARGVSIAEDEALIAQRKATVQFVEDENRKQAAIGRTTGALRGSAGIIGAGGVRGALASSSGGNALFGKVSGGKGPNLSAAVAGAAAVTGAAPSGVAAFTLVERRRAAELAAANGRLTAAQLRYDAALKTAIPNQIRMAAADLDSAKAASALAEVNQRLLFPADARLIEMTRQLTLAQRELSIAQTQGLSSSVAASRIASLQSGILARQRLLASPVNTSPAAATGFLALSGRAKEIQAAKAMEEANVKSARITATSWGTAVEGMKSVAKIGFSFIAFSFAADLASKVIFSSHETKKAVVHDLFDIQKAGIGTASALAIGLGLGASKLRALGAGGGIIAGLKAIEFGAISGRAKVGLLLASVLGLQAAGVNLETTFNVVFGLLAVRSLLKLVAGAGVASLGIRGIGRSAEVAAVETGAASGQMALELTGVGVAAERTSLQVAGIGVAGRLAALAWPIALAAGIEVILKKLHPVQTVLGTIDKFFAQHIDPHIPFIGGSRAKADARAAVKDLGAEVKKDSDKLFGPGLTIPVKVKVKTSEADDALFKQLGAGLPERVTKAAQELRDSGNEYAAEQVFAEARTKQQLQNVKDAVAFLRSHGKADIANLIEPISKQIKAVRHQFDDLFSSISDSVLRAFDNHTARLLDSFDATTSKLEDHLKVLVKLPKLHETFTVDVSGKTPAEKELAALDKVEQKRNSQRGIFDARSDLATAFQVGDPAAIRDAQRKLEDAETAKKRAALDVRAKAEREAADKALTNGKTALDNRRSNERRNLEAQRAVEHDQIEQALKAEQTMYDNGKIGLKRYYADVRKLMAGHNITLAQAGKDGGLAYSEQMQGYFDRLQKAIDKDLTKITKKATNTAAALKKVGGLEGLLGKGSVGGIPNLALSLTPAGAKLLAAQEADHDNRSREGVPLHDSIVNAIKAVGSPPYRDKELSLVPKAVRPTDTEYEDFIKSLPATDRKPIRAFLRKTGFARAARGGVVPGFASGGVIGGLDPSARSLFDFVGKKKRHKYGRQLTDPFPPGDSLAPNGRGIRHDLLDRHPGKIRGWRNDDRNGLNWPNQPPPAPWIRKAATGAVVGGTGRGDTVPAMLTPGEVIFNAPQQEWLRGVLGIGGGPHGLFNFVASNAQHFAGGGVTGGSLPSLPGFDDLGPALKRLIATLAKSAVIQQNFLKNPRLSAIFSGVGTTGDGGITKKLSEDKLRQLRATLAPPHIEGLVNADPTLRGLSLNRKKELEQGLARLQAHPFNSGLATSTPTGATMGGTHRLAPGHEIPNGGALFTGPIYIKVDGGAHADGYAQGQEIRRGLQGHAERNANVRSGMRGGSRIGLG